MNSTICTLFEGDYHYGVAALTNSLYANGFSGTIYAGYRGLLPKWTENAKQQAVGKWSDALVLDVAEGLQLIFIPLTTDYHLTNYKPDFMLELLDDPAKNTDAIFYFDPDICVAEQWRFFEEWVSCGVALCEDVYSPLPENHPRRIGWRGYFLKYNFVLKFRAPEYVNGGFVGIAKEHFSFLKLWRDLQVAMVDHIGTFAASKLSRGASYKSKGFANCFDSSDQDALNAASEATEFHLSVIGKEAMGFRFGGTILPHAIGNGKPWQRINLTQALLGRSPRFVDKLFWKSVSTPIECFQPITVLMYRIDLILATAVSRFYRSG
ncbi:MAG: hypothetical protein WAW36_03170 [Methylovulum miyakonense]|uniref:hypothetical protein n=1 Tax=Methylovulum miyakonense TaxID=645578 RepID=UPI003BB7CBD9